MNRLAVFVLPTALLLSGAAQATPALPSNPTAAFHLGQKALDIVTQVALANMPSHVALADVDKDLGICGMSVQVSNASLDLVPHSLSLQVGNGSMAMAGSLDVSGSAHVVVNNGYACISTAECDITFSAKPLSANADVSMSVSSGQPTMSLGTVGATVPDGGLNITFSNCILSDLSDGLVDSMAQAMLQLSQGLIGDKLREIVPPIVEAQMTAMLSQSGSVNGYGWAAKLETLSITENGVDAYADVGVDWEGPGAACLPPNTADSAPATIAPSSLKLPAAPTSSIMVGVTTNLVSSAIAAAWQSGVLCMDDSALATLGFDASQLTSLIPGLPAGLTTHFSVGIDNPPKLTVDSTGELVMSVQGAELLLVLEAAGQPPAGVVVATDFTVGVTPTVDSITGGIYASLGKLAITRLDIDAGASQTTYTIDPERLAVLVQDVVVPMAQQRLQGMPISAASFAAPTSFGPVYTWLSDLGAHDSAVYVGLEAFVPPSAPDTVTPTTILQQTPGAYVRAGMARFQVDGNDDVTPEQLVRYEWQLDDGAISAPAFARSISAPVTTAGSHTFRVRAVDLAGNVDPSWQESSFTLDSVPPTLTITQQPLVSLRGSKATIALTGSDDISAPSLLSYAYRIARRAPGGDLTTIGGAEPTGLSGGAATFDVTQLKDGDSYEITVLLYDQAGNVTSQKVGFAVASTGCSMGGDAPSSFGALLLVGLALLFATRRRYA